MDDGQNPIDISLITPVIIFWHFNKLISRVGNLFTHHSVPPASVPVTYGY